MAFLADDGAFFYFKFCQNIQSLKEYEEKAVSLALNRPKLQDLSNKLKEARMTCPLFDTLRWVSVYLCFFTIEVLFLFFMPCK